MGKENCWEFKQCGREPGGLSADELGVCPAAAEERLDGVNHGHNAGRICWVVAGTMCNGEPQGTFVDKYRDCSLCEFFRMVRAQEGEPFIIISLDHFKKG